MSAGQPSPTCYSVLTTCLLIPATTDWPTCRSRLCTTWAIDRLAKLLEKLRIEQTKSRSRHSNDNALAESKNASEVRKHMSYAYIPQRFAQRINAFYQDTFKPWLKLHRPCRCATQVMTDKSKIIKRYRNTDAKTPLESPVQLDAQG